MNNVTWSSLMADSSLFCDVMGRGVAENANIEISGNLKRRIH
jgi:hypothetical protein